MILQQMGMLADLVAEHHGVDHLEYDPRTSTLSCRASNNDTLTHALRVFEEYGFICCKHMRVEDNYTYFDVDIEASFTRIPLPD